MSREANRATPSRISHQICSVTAWQCQDCTCCDPAWGGQSNGFSSRSKGMACSWQVLGTIKWDHLHLGPKPVSLKQPAGQEMSRSAGARPLSPDNRGPSSSNTSTWKSSLPKKPKQRPPDLLKLNKLSLQSRIAPTWKLKGVNSFKKFMLHSCNLGNTK
jgi:hypothetical protein